MKVDIDLAIQFGKKAYELGNAEISSFVAAAYFIYYFASEKPLWFGTGFDRTGGISITQISRSEIEAFFSADYYSKHKFLGHMDYFTDDQSDLTGLKFLCGFSPWKSLKTSMDFHFFLVKDSDYSEFSKSPSKITGKELDITADYYIRKGLSARYGFDLFFPSKDWHGKNAGTAVFSYLSFTAVF